MDQHTLIALIYSHAGISDRVLSASLASMGIAVSLMSVIAIIMWMIAKSVLLRRSTTMYAFLGMLFCCTLDRVIPLFGPPLWLQLTVNFFTTIGTLTAAAIIYSQRFTIMRAVYQFKYTIGLLRNLDVMDKRSREGD